MSKTFAPIRNSDASGGLMHADISPRAQKKKKKEKKLGVPDEDASLTNRLGQLTGGVGPMTTKHRSTRT